MTWVLEFWQCAMTPETHRTSPPKLSHSHFCFLLNKPNAFVTLTLLYHCVDKGRLAIDNNTIVYSYYDYNRLIKTQPPQP